MTWDEIVVEFEAYQNMSCTPTDVKKYKEGTIIDEDKTVRWNREEVERRNAEYRAVVGKLNTVRNKARDTVFEHIYAYIKDELGAACTQKKAEAIWNYAYEAGHAYGIVEIKNYLDEIMDLAEILMGKE